VLAATGSTAAVPFTLLDRVITFTQPDGTAGVSSAVLSLARLATEIPMVRLKVLTAVALVGTVVTASVGGRFLATSAAQAPAVDPSRTNLGLPTDYQPPIRGTLDPNTALPAAPRHQWEYRVLPLPPDAQAELNKLGAQGWELVAVDRTVAGLATAYLKRAKASEDASAINERTVYAGRGLRLTLPRSSQESITVPLGTISAATAATIVKTLYGQEAGFSGATPEERTNSLILTGTPEKLKDVKALIEKIDAAKSNKEPEPAR
jgi:hypothetical protein